MVRTRRGASKIGCLFAALILAALVYFGAGIGQVFWSFYKYQDRMKQEARFAAHRSDAVIIRRVAAFADSLGLPEGARNVRVRRGNRMIYIWAEYYEHLELPGFVKEWHFNPSATGTF
ncbi:MAG TPA: hypothetical protein VIH11_05610 [Gemmatimonadaceae bacterium]|nr:hypothetical protein [Gemmatimonadaceae bacterium]